jgi:two-component system response regulator PilR (NtrC family)
LHQERGAPAQTYQPLRLAESQYAALLRWCARRELSRGLSQPLLGLDLGATEREVLAAPLHSGDSATGAVLLVAPRTKHFSQAEQKLVATLLDGFGAALDNHIRLKEMARLKDAAEADRRSLLARLGRDALEDDIIGSSRGLKPVLQRVAMVASSDASVLILGETGAGKEVVARAIHTRSTRAAGPFIRVNCGAISPELIDSELFGHEKGSFTGAVGQRRGWFERADGGTLFLDEVAELPLHMQVKLLRVIQEKAIRAVGAQRETAVDVRILSATHRNLNELVRAGRFREDLYYRINVIELRVPPLRERSEDIPLLAAHVLERLAGKEGTPAKLAPDATQLLQSHGFPGNVRELENILERATTLAEDDFIHAADIHLQAGAEKDEAEPVTAPASAPGQPLGKHLDDVEKEAIRKALEQARYNKTAAAKILGMSFRQLRYRIKKLGLE